MLYRKSEVSLDINLALTIIVTIIVNLILTKKVILKMNERVEIEVNACCPKCGHSFSDWISFNMDYFLLFKNLSGQNEKSEGEIENV